jgi:hypothetical protein
MSAASYFKAAIPEPFRIFGVRLLPLSIGRYRLMARFGCAFVAEEESSATMDDLLLGIMVCSMRCDEFLAFIESGTLEQELKRWGARIRAEIKREEHFSLLEKIGLFQRYLTEASAIPQYWQETEAQGGSAAHWAQSLEVTLRSELGYTLEEIQEGPLSKAIVDYFKHHENQGSIRLMTEEEIQQAEANERLFAGLEGKSGSSCLAAAVQSEEGKWA